jgi:hypothetical protein
VSGDRRTVPAKLDPVKATALADWPRAQQIPCEHAGLLLLLPAMAQIGLADLVAQAGYPATRAPAGRAPARAASRVPSSGCAARGRRVNRLWCSDFRR